MPALFTPIGPTEEVTSCDCCGRTDLRSTVALRHNATGGTVHFGRECAEQACHPWAALAPRFAQWAAVGGLEGGTEDDSE